MPNEIRRFEMMRARFGWIRFRDLHASQIIMVCEDRASN
jgi:hypothetical protein